MREDFPLPDVTWEPTREFWAGAAAQELRMPHCDGCQRICWYPERCMDCGGEAFTWRPVSGRAKLFTWVVVTHPFLPQYASQAPFVSALVTPEEDERVRVPTRIVDCAPEDLALGQPLEVCFRPLSFDDVPGEVIAPFFRPV